MAPPSPPSVTPSSSATPRRPRRLSPSPYPSPSTSSSPALRPPLGLASSSKPPPSARTELFGCDRCRSSGFFLIKSLSKKKKRTGKIFLLTASQNIFTHGKPDRTHSSFLNAQFQHAESLVPATCELPAS